MLFTAAIIFQAIFNIVRPKKKLIIMRGLPGSGKSTLAATLAKDRGEVFSTDTFFEQDGKYKFDPRKLRDFHRENQKNARSAMKSGVPVVVIDNTNLTFWEMSPYVQAGLEYGYSIEFVEPKTSWRFNPEQLALHCTHNVAQDIIEGMVKRWMHLGNTSAIEVANATPPWAKKT